MEVLQASGKKPTNEPEKSGRDSEDETLGSSDGSLRKTAACHDIIETKWVSVYRQNVSTLYLTEINRVNVKVGIQGGRYGVVCHDVSETK